jgi:hypothetical protein
MMKIIKTKVGLLELGKHWAMYRTCPAGACLTCLTRKNLREMMKH